MRKNREVDILLCTCIFILILFFLLNLCTKILIPKKTGATESKMSEFFSLKENGVDVQILLLGSSHIEEGFPPIELWEKYNIIAYNLGCSDCSFFTAYSILKEALKTQKPKLVIFDCGMLFRKPIVDNRIYSINLLVDEFPFSKNKVSMAYNLTQYTPDDFNNTFWGCVFPLYRYHGRWKSLGWNYFNKKISYNDGFSNLGHWPEPNVKSAEVTQADIDWFFEKSEGFENSYKVSENLDAESVEYLLATKKMCQELGISLLAIKVPTYTNPTNYTSWTYKKYEKAKDFFAEQNITFMDLQYDYSLPIDWHHDTHDGGKHLNISGATKVADFLGDYIVKNYDLVPQKSQYYDLCAIEHNKISYVTDLELTYTLPEYVEKLKTTHKNSTIFITVNNEMTVGISDEEKSALNSFGLTPDFNPTDFFSYSYIAVIKDGILEYENFQKNKQTYEYVLSDERTVKITSSGYLTGAFSEIIIDERDECVNHRGINIVVLDNDSGLVLDSVCFDTFDADNNDAIRNGHTRVFEYFYKYKDYILRKEAQNL